MALMTSTNGKPAEAAADDIAAQMQAIRADLAALTEAVGDYGRAKGRVIGEKVSNAASDLRARGEVEAERLGQAANVAYAQTNDFVARQPATALGIAAGLGFLVGLWSQRK